MTQDEQTLFSEVMQDVIAADNDEIKKLVRDTRKLLLFIEAEAIKRGLVVYE